MFLFKYHVIRFMPSQDPQPPLIESDIFAYSSLPPWPFSMLGAKIFDKEGGGGI